MAELKKEEKKLGLGILVRNNVFLFRIACKYAPLYVVCTVVEGIAWGINNAIELYYTKMLFDMIGEDKPFLTVLNLIVFMAVYNMVLYLCHYSYWKVLKPIIQKNLQYRLHTELFEKARSLDLACYDDPEFYNDFIWSINESDGRVTKQLDDLSKLINRSVASVLVTGLIVTIHPILAAIIFFFTAARIVFQMLAAKVDYNRAQDFNPLDRKTNYVNRMFRLADCAKEIRLTRVSENLLCEHEKAIDEKMKIVRKYAAKRYWLAVATWGMMSLGDGIVILFLLYELLVTGSIALGDFAAGVTAIWQLSWLLRDLLDRLVKSKEHALFVDKMKTFLAYQPKIVGGTKIPGAFESLELRGVRFAYKDDEILRGISLKISKGDKIAFVGYNGAGKTTLVKLLMRLYDPTEGEILYNGINIKEYDLDAYRACIGAVFQDYKIFASTVAENVLADVDDGTCRDNVLTALQKSAFEEKLVTLEKGIDTELTREFYKDGTNLSGGEEQKIAIARVFAKPCELLIMDEPSSALDPISEYKLNHSISESASEKTVIFISHRLSTTRHADRIYMFESGRIIEEGTHDELVANTDGKYYGIWHAQAQYYTEQ